MTLDTTQHTECGLVAPKAYPWIAATPDGFVHDPQALPPQGLVEVIAAEINI